MKSYSIRWLITLLISLPIRAYSSTTPVEHSQKQHTQQESLQHNAQQWGLSQEEYLRYQALMKSQRGVQSPGLDPLTTLGVEAQNDQERRRYAELFVKQEFQRVEKELAFQREVDKAWQRLFANTPLIAALPGESISQTNHRVALFVQQDCEPCKVPLQKILHRNQPVDIYLLNSQGNDDQVRLWASQHQIPMDKVRNGNITLNHDNGLWQQYGQGMMPVVLEKGEGGWNVVAY